MLIASGSWKVRQQRPRILYWWLYLLFNSFRTLIIHQGCRGLRMLVYPGYLLRLSNLIFVRIVLWLVFRQFVDDIIFGNLLYFMCFRNLRWCHLFFFNYSSLFPLLIIFASCRNILSPDYGHSQWGRYFLGCIFFSRMLNDYKHQLFTNNNWNVRIFVKYIRVTFQAKT